MLGHDPRGSSGIAARCTLSTLARNYSLWIKIYVLGLGHDGEILGSIPTRASKKNRLADPRNGSTRGASHDEGVVTHDGGAVRPVRSPTTTDFSGNSPPPRVLIPHTLRVEPQRWWLPPISPPPSRACCDEQHPLRLLPLFPLYPLP